MYHVSAKTFTDVCMCFLFSKEILDNNYVASRYKGTCSDGLSEIKVTFYTFRLSGLSPFQGETDEETLGNIVALKYEFEPRYFSQTSSMAKDFIQKLLVKDQRYCIWLTNQIKHSI